MNRRGFLLGGLVSIVLSLTACSTDDPDGGATSSTANSTTTSSNALADSTSTTAATEPPGTQAAVKPILQALIDRYDKAVATILADPRVAANREHEAVAAYLRLFAPGSAFPQTALKFWVDEGAQGHFYRPGPLGQMYKSTLQSMIVDSPDQVTFLVCSLKSIVIVNEAGTELSAEGGQSAGSVTAVRVDGTWLLRDLTRNPADDCPDPRTQS